MQEKEKKPLFWLKRIWKNRVFQVCLQLLLAGGFTLLQTWQLQYSAVDGIRQVFQLALPILLLNWGVLLALNLAAKLLLQRWSWAMYLTAVLTTAWSIINFFVMKFHGSPLFFSEFRNLGAALDVADGYRFVWERRLTWLLLLGIAEAGCGLLVHFLQQRDRWFRLRRFLRNLGALICVCGVLWFLLFVRFEPKPRKTMGWTWRTSVDTYGYTCAIVEDVDRSLNAIVKPDGYDPVHLDALEPAAYTEPEVLPDLILIVNESFCDLHETLDFTTDVDCMEGFYGHSGAVYGKAIITSVGGATNNTEYELLTSNSMHLLTMAAPFNYVNFSREHKNIVSYLKPLGYTSLGMHCADGSNYSRNRAYPELGFDRVLFGKKNFTYNTNGRRRWLDSDNYRDLIRYYNEMDEGPRLVYQLTYQNHGGYELNSSKLDTVHVQEDFGDYTDDLNEYLSSMRLSSQAFDELVSYYETVDRPVIILMLGDHAPTLINHIPIARETNEADTEIRKRTVPYVIWANYPVSFPPDMDTVTLTDLVPLLLEAAGLPLSRYHEQLLALHEVMPARTLNGYYRDADGAFGRLDESCPWYALLQTYYEMEYNALRGGSAYRKELFELP